MSSKKSTVPYSVVDAFTAEAFKGNPAAVCLLPEDLCNVDEHWMQDVAKEFNISESCFLFPSGTTDHNVAQFQLRWFTPVAEVKLCGHATLAAAHFLYTSELVKNDAIEFATKSGILTAKKILKENNTGTQNNGDELDRKFLIELNFPMTSVGNSDASDLPSIPMTLNGASIVKVHKIIESNDLIVELSSHEEVVNLRPDFTEIKNCAGRGVVITSRAPNGSAYDFFTRFFCPKMGINEDPVCGSVHCALAPFWGRRMGKQAVTAYMASPRGGVLHLEYDETTRRVLIRGEAVTVMAGNLLA